MPGVWAQSSEGRWQSLTSTGFVSEAELHDLIEQAPTMLPLAGTSTLAIVGKEVLCGRERADLVAVELETGRPVVVEIKLASNTDRRRSLTQVLGYAAYLRRLDADGLNAVLRGYLEQHNYASVTHAARAAAHADPTFDEEAFQARFEQALAEGRLRAVIVLDEAPADLVELVGYIQDVTSDRLVLDLVLVAAYEVAGQRVLVPQLVEPDRTQVTAALAGTGKPSTGSQIVPGSRGFADSIDTAPTDQRPTLRRLLSWALELERAGLAVLFTSIGKGRWVLNPRLPGQSRAMVAIWNDKGAYLSPYHTVFAQEAPTALAKLDTLTPNQIGQGNYIKGDYDDQLLTVLREAYVEARRTRT